MEIRRARAEDISAITAAEKEIFPDPWTERDINTSVSVDGSMCYCAVSDGVLYAYIIGRVIAPEGEIYRIATLPKYRGRGIAYRLLSYAVKTERGRGLERLFLEVREQNKPARALYNSFGFTEIGIRKNYYKDPADNAILMMHAGRGDI